ncbi:MAG TPA: MarR family transcriptional regulator [Burkholderiaceae bacterium]|nr:MarR family transcriptional regulator [Burkholderiaceae bacterium]
MAQDDRRQQAKLDAHEYALLAAFRYALRSFMRFSESAAEGVGLTAQHYQALLVLRGCPEDQRVTINDLAQQLLIRHNSAVGLVDRLHKQGLIAREPSPLDGRKVYLRLTARGERVLERLASVHREELRRIGPQLRQLLQQITRATEGQTRYD